MNPLVWVDLETTGLNPNLDTVLEVAMIATDRNLFPLTSLETGQPVPEPLNFTIMPGRGGLDLAKWDPVVVEMHTLSGLVADIIKNGISLDGAGGARDRVEAWLRKLAHSQGMSLSTTGKPSEHEELRFIMAGSTIRFDRAFFEGVFDMDLFHYRSIDVSTVKELVRGWYGDDAGFDQGQVEKAHRALDDIRVSIAELRYYREQFFLDPGGLASSVS